MVGPLGCEQRDVSRVERPVRGVGDYEVKMLLEAQTPVRGGVSDGPPPAAQFTLETGSVCQQLRPASAPIDPVAVLKKICRVRQFGRTRILNVTVSVIVVFPSRATTVQR